MLRLLRVRATAAELLRWDARRSSTISQSSSWRSVRRAEAEPRGIKRGFATNATDDDLGEEPSELSREEAVEMLREWSSELALEAKEAPIMEAKLSAQLKDMSAEGPLGPEFEEIRKAYKDWTAQVAVKQSEVQRMLKRLRDSKELETDVAERVHMLATDRDEWLESQSEMRSMLEVDEAAVEQEEEEEEVEEQGEEEVEKDAEARELDRLTGLAGEAQMRTARYPVMLDQLEDALQPETERKLVAQDARLPLDIDPFFAEREFLPDGQDYEGIGPLGTKRVHPGVAAEKTLHELEKTVTKFHELAKNESRTSKAGDAGEVSAKMAPRFEDYESCLRSFLLSFDDFGITDDLKVKEVIEEVEDVKAIEPSRRLLPEGKYHWTDERYEDGLIQILLAEETVDVSPEYGSETGSGARGLKLGGFGKADDKAESTPPPPPPRAYDVEVKEDDDYDDRDRSGPYDRSDRIAGSGGFRNIESLDPTDWRTFNREFVREDAPEEEEDEEALYDEEDAMKYKDRTLKHGVIVDLRGRMLHVVNMVLCEGKDVEEENQWRKIPIPTEWVTAMKKVKWPEPWDDGNVRYHFPANTGLVEETIIRSYPLEFSSAASRF